MVAFGLAPRLGTEGGGVIAEWHEHKIVVLKKNIVKKCLLDVFIRGCR